MLSYHLCDTMYDAKATFIFNNFFFKLKKRILERKLSLLYFRFGVLL